MRNQKFMLTAIALAAASCVGSAHAQATNEQLQQALIQAQQAAAQAQAAAAQAQAALAQIQAQAQAQAQADAQAKSAGQIIPNATGPGTGLTYTSGANSVTLYGLLDVTLSHVDHLNAAGDSRTSYHPSPWFSGSRWGMTGSRTIGPDGLKAIFRLESEFVTNTGEEDAAGILFGRDAWAGFESDTLGKVSFGRQNALGRDFAASYLDPYGNAKTTTNEGGGTNTNNFKQLIFYAGSATGTRYDRGLVWKKDFHNGVVGGLGYQFGGVAGSFSTGSTKSAALGYNGGAFNVAGFVNSANVAGLTHNSASIGGNFTTGIVRVNAGLFRYTADQGAGGSLARRKDNAWTVSTNIAPAGKIDYQLGYQVMSATNAGITGTGAASNTLNAYADTTGVTAVGSGKRKTLYASAFYHFDKTTEVYVVADRLSLTDSYRHRSAGGFSNQTEFGVGLRLRF
jgi:predicted porin